MKATFIPDNSGDEAYLHRRLSLTIGLIYVRFVSLSLCVWLGGKSHVFTHVSSSTPCLRSNERRPVLGSNFLDLVAPSIHLLFVHFSLLFLPLSLPFCIAVNVRTLRNTLPVGKQACLSCQAMLTDPDREQPENEFETVETSPCPYCSRCFATSRLPKHELVCRKRTEEKGTRPQYDATLKRAEVFIGNFFTL